jgi:hypothetical protein
MEQVAFNFKREWQKYGSGINTNLNNSETRKFEYLVEWPKD